MNHYLSQRLLTYVGLWLLVCWISIPVAASATPRVLILGDSISAGYGIADGEGWVSLLQKRLRQEQLPVEVINASISGETTQGGLRRLPDLLDTYQPAVVLIELGGNDGLRGFPLNLMQQNLNRMTELSQQAGAQVLLAGMMLPPNYGEAFTRAFHQSFHTTAQRYNTPLIPFLLEGIGTDPSLMQRDGIHPNQQAQQRLLDNVWPFLLPLLENHDAEGSDVASQAQL